MLCCATLCAYMVLPHCLDCSTHLHAGSGMVNYHDLLFALAWKVMGVKFDKGVKNQQVGGRHRCIFVCPILPSNGHSDHLQGELTDSTAFCVVLVGGPLSQDAPFPRHVVSEASNARDSQGQSQATIFGKVRAKDRHERKGEQENTLADAETGSEGAAESK
jgi:hypothetical protein